MNFLEFMGIFYTPFALIIGAAWIIETVWKWVESR